MKYGSTLSEKIEFNPNDDQNRNEKLDEFMKRQRSVYRKNTSTYLRTYNGSVYDNLYNSSTGFGKKSKRKEQATSSKSFRGVKERNANEMCNRHSFMYTMMNGKSSQLHSILFKNIISLIIVTDILFFFSSTEPYYENNPIFHIEEGIVSSIFLCEYIIRLISITESHKYKSLGPVKGRLKYAFSFNALIDAFATFPFFIEILFKIDLPTLTFLRFFRLMRILRTDPLLKAMDSLRRVIYYNQEILRVAAVLAAYLIMFTAILMYYLRPRHNLTDEPEWSILTCVYYSTLLLTGQGGPDGEMPWYTKSVILITGLFSIGMFAIPASMLTWGFEAEAARVAAKTRKRYMGDSSSSVTSQSSFSDSASVPSADEEYLNILVGDDDSDSDETGLDWKVDLQKIHDVLSKFENGPTTDIMNRIEKMEKKVDQILQTLQTKE